MSDKYSEVYSKYAGLILDFRERFSDDSVIAGGAIRDILLARPTKDVDFITSYLMTIEDAETFFAKSFRRVRISRAEYDDGLSDGGSSLRYVLASLDNTINVLVVSDVDDKIASFPDTISMVYFDGMQIVTTPQFRKAVETKVVEYAPRTTAERLERLLTKFPDFNFHQSTEEILA